MAKNDKSQKSDSLRIHNTQLRSALEEVVNRTKAFKDQRI